MPIIWATQEMEVEGSWSEAGPGKAQDLIWKITKAKNAKDVVQVVERLQGPKFTPSIATHTHIKNS
jgi:hypothetical protein